MTVISGKSDKKSEVLRKENNNRNQNKNKDSKNDSTHYTPNLSFLPTTGVDIELSNESKRKIRRRSDYKIWLKYSEDNGKRCQLMISQYQIYIHISIYIFC